MAKEDRFGREVKVSNGNFASRVLPVKIHDLDPEDNALLENELGGPLRSVDFIYKSAGVNRPMKPNDERFENLNRAYYRDQINKVANAVKEIILGLKYPGMPIGSSSSGIEPDKNEGIIRNSIPKLRWAALAFVIAIAIGFLVWIIASARSEPVADPDVGVPKVKSIIVLPFASLKSAQSADDYLEDGVTSAIVTELTKIKELSVISEAISRSFKNRENNLKTIAEEEHVNYVLQGSVQRVNDRVKISAQLIDVSTGFQLWADRFERKLVDIFAIQDDISSSIAKALK